MQKTFEVEIKSLLGSRQNADKLKRALSKTYPNIKLLKKGKQLNHYFNIPSELKLLENNLLKLIPKIRHDLFGYIMGHGNKISLRSRDTDGKIILVMKASVGDDSSSNGVKRIEFEEIVPVNHKDLDQIILDSGCSYQAKWSRIREEYGTGEMRVCIDKNAGYGYLAEFEKISTDESSLDKVRRELLDIMERLGFSELPQDRLERMFAHYNSHWEDYYGTDKVFVVE